MPPSEGHGGRGDWGGGYGGGGGGPYGGGGTGHYSDGETGPYGGGGGGGHGGGRGGAYRGGGGVYGGREAGVNSGGGGGYGDRGAGAYRGGGGGYGGREAGAYNGEGGGYGAREAGAYNGGGGGYVGREAGAHSVGGRGYGGRGAGPFSGDEAGVSSSGEGGTPYGGGRQGGYHGGRRCDYRDGGRAHAKNQERGRSVPIGLRGRSGLIDVSHQIAQEYKPLKSLRFIIMGRRQRTDCERKIISMGGTILSSTEYELATHIVTLENVTEGANILWEMEGKKVVGSAWVEQHENPTSADCNSPTVNKDKRVVISTSKRKRTCVHRSSSSKKNLFPHDNDKDEIETYKFHHWLQCPFDRSTTFTLEHYIAENKDSVVRLLQTPGSETTHISLLTSNQVKMYVRKSYLVLAAMNSEQMTLRGEFGAINFVIDKLQSVKLGNLDEDALKSSTSEDDFRLDREGFVKMVKNEVLSGKSIPNDMFEWLTMLSKGAPQDLLSCHIAVLEDHLGGHILMTLYDNLLDLKKSDPPSYKAVLLELKKYDTWKKRRFIENSYLRETYEHMDMAGNKTDYKSNVKGLLHLFRNCKRHAAISVEVFGCIVGQHFRRIASDFQRAMYNVKSLQKLNLQYTLS